MKAPIPADEAERLADLDALDVVGSEPSEPWDRIARLASFVCGTPIALVGVIDEHHHWFKAAVGTEIRQNDREHAVCAHLMDGPDYLEVPDLSQDERFHDNPFVQGEPHLRFYAGVPVESPWGHRLGTICVYDLAPRELSEAQRAAMKDLSYLANDLFALRAQELRLRALGTDAAEQELHDAARDVLNESRHNLATPLTPLLLQLATLSSQVKDDPSLASSVAKAQEHGRHLREVVDAVTANIARRVGLQG